jgi:hypothetical protein
MWRGRLIEVRDVLRRGKRGNWEVDMISLCRGGPDHGSVVKLLQSRKEADASTAVDRYVLSVWREVKVKAYCKPARHIAPLEL